MDDEQFKKDILEHIACLGRDVAALRSSMADIKSTLEGHTKLIRCVGGSRRYPTELTSVDRAPVCRDYRSSMMSMREILGDFNELRRGRYEEAGSCGLAGADSWDFFERAHKLMQPKLVTGVLYSPSGGKLVMSQTDTSPDSAAGISPNMKPFKRHEGCIWVRDESSAPVENVCGASHRVTLVTTLDGERIVVDWGICQFSSLPDDTRLFIHCDDLKA